MLFPGVMIVKSETLTGFALCHFIDGEPSLFSWNEKKLFITEFPTQQAKRGKRYTTIILSDLNIFA